MVSAAGVGDCWINDDERADPADRMFQSHEHRDRNFRKTFERNWYPKNDGKPRGHLIFQFMGETTMVCLLALVFGLGISDLLISGWNSMTSNNIHLEPLSLMNSDILLFLGGILLFAGVVAGSYPAFYISRFKPASIFERFCCSWWQQFFY